MCPTVISAPDFVSGSRFALPKEKSRKCMFASLPDLLIIGQPQVVSNGHVKIAVTKGDGGTLGHKSSTYFALALRS